MIVEKLLGAGADVTITCFNKTLEEHVKENIPGLDLSKITKTRAPLVKSTGSLGKLTEIVDKSGVSGEVSSEDLDEFKSLLLELDSAERNR